MSAPRRIAYVTGTRADFGLMRSTLAAIDAHPSLSLSIYATGMHLDPAYGATIEEIEASGLPLAGRVLVETGPPTGALMARNLGRITIGLADVFAANRPDILLVLGDRGEMLAAAIAAIHLNIPIAHIHGGERSGTVDEPVRHAISKLSHLHLVATEESHDRLIRMGERGSQVMIVGAPGLDGIADVADRDIAGLHARHGLDPTRPTALFLYHPVLQESGTAASGAIAALDALTEAGLQILALRPNSDAGSVEIIDVLERYYDARRITIVTHLPRAEYLSFLRAAAILVGNSSSGIIEAASFGTPVVNIGLRQNFRERNANVLDTPATAEAIRAALARALAIRKSAPTNVYGDGTASTRIVASLQTLDLDDPALMAKLNAY